jgi:hypothetical protein
MYICHVSSEKQIPSEKRDKCNIMVFSVQRYVYYVYMKREVIVFLETSVVLCRLHETAFQIEKSLYSPLWKLNISHRNEINLISTTKLMFSWFIFTYDRELRKHVEREAVWAPTRTFTTSIVVCCQVVILLVISAIYVIWDLTITFSRTTIKI